MDSGLSIRLPTPADVPAMLGIYAPFVLNSIVSFETEVPSVIDFWGRVQKVLAEAPWLVGEIEGEIAGYAYASKHRSRTAYQWTRELSVYVGEPYRKYGVGKALYSILIRLLQQQGYANVLAGITLPNAPSVAFHEKMGFRPVGIYHRVGYKYGAYQDVGWWELVIRQEAPGDILAFGEVVESDEWKVVVSIGAPGPEKRK